MTFREFDQACAWVDGYYEQLKKAGGGGGG
jgi:hypothetical protein